MSKVDITKLKVLYRAPGVDRVQVRRDVEYEADLTVDIYYPPDSQIGVRIPVVVIVAGYAGSFKDIGWCISWGELIAASGMVAITCSTREPVTNLEALVRYLRENSAALGIDENRIGLFAGSGNVPNALALLMQADRDYLKAAVLCSGFTLDLDGSTSVADAAKTFGFVNPSAGKTVDELPVETPLFVLRAGKDQFSGLNDALDRFVGKALSRNLPITVVNSCRGCTLQRAASGGSGVWFNPLLARPFLERAGEFHVRRDTDEALH